MNLFIKLLWFVLAAVVSSSCSMVSIDAEEAQSESQARDNQYFEVKELTNGYSKIKIVNNALKQHVNRAEFSWSLSILITLDEPKADGSPTKQEEEYLNQFQEFVEEKLSTIGDYKYVGRITWNGERQIEYYIADPAIIERFLSAMINAKRITNNMTFDIKKDENWENYSRFYAL